MRSCRPISSPLLYLASGMLFILALRGLSSPATLAARQLRRHARHAHRHGDDAGRSANPQLPLTWILIGAGLGRRRPRRRRHRRARIAMTAMPELVAAFHSLVGLAAVFVAAAALYAPEAFGIGKPGTIASASLIEMSLGVAIGAITFTGSVIAFAKLSGRMSGKPIILPLRHLINLALFARPHLPHLPVLPVGRRSAAVLGHHADGDAVRRR